MMQICDLDVEFLLPVKFRRIPFPGWRENVDQLIREEVENVSAHQRPGLPSCFSSMYIFSLWIGWFTFWYFQLVNWVVYFLILSACELGGLLYYDLHVYFQLVNWVVYFIMISMYILSLWIGWLTLLWSPCTFCIFSVCELGGWLYCDLHVYFQLVNWVVDFIVISMYIFSLWIGWLTLLWSPCIFSACELGGLLYHDLHVYFKLVNWPVDFIVISMYIFSLWIGWFTLSRSPCICKACELAGWLYCDLKVYFQLVNWVVDFIVISMYIFSLWIGWFTLLWSAPKHKLGRGRWSLASCIQTW